MWQALLANFWFVQAIGAVALLFLAGAFLQSTRRRILLVQLVGALFFVAHFLLLSAYTGAAMNAFVVLRNVVFEEFKRRAAWLFIFLGLAMLLLVYSWQGWVSAFPVAAVVVATYGVWQGNTAVLRALELAATLLWVPYVIAMHSYAGLLTQAVIGCALLVGIASRDLGWIHRRWSTFIQRYHAEHVRPPQH